MLQNDKGPVRGSKAPNKPKFPNAKTYKDKQGNIREVGTGRLIRRATGAASTATTTTTGKPGAKFPNAKTFKDAQGVVRTIGTGVAVNPIDRQIDAQILVQSSPLKNQLGDASRQSESEQAAITATRDANAQIIQQMQAAAQQQASHALGLASQYGSGTADAQQQNLAYLRGLLGEDLGAGALGALAATAQGEIAAGGTAGYLTGMGAGRDAMDMQTGVSLQGGNMLADRMAAFGATKRDIEDQLAAIKANRTAIRNELINQKLDQDAARQQIKLAQIESDRAGQQQTFEQQLAQDTLDAQKAEAAAENGGASRKGGPFGIGTDEAVNQMIAAKIGQFNNLPAAKRNYARLIAALTKTGAVSVTEAIKVANRSYGMKRLRAEGSYRIYKALKDAGAPLATQKTIIRNVFGKNAWNQLVNALDRRPGQTSQDGTQTRPGGTVVNPNVTPGGGSTSVSYG